MRIEAPSCFEVFMDLSNHHLHNPAVIRRITLDTPFTGEMSIGSEAYQLAYDQHMAGS